MLKCYLIGSMTGLSHSEANAPRQQFIDKINSLNLNLKCLNPVIGWDFENFYEYSPREVVAHNDMFLDQSDIGVLFNTPPLNVLTSPGSLYEIYYYKWHPEKPLFSIGELPNKPHILESVTKQFNTDDECIEYLIAIYGQLL